MNIGFTLDEKVFSEITPLALIAKTKNLGVSSIEISPDENILSLKKYDMIAKHCSELNMDVNFHVPYFAHDYLYEINNFIELKKSIIQKYESFISIVEKIQNITCSKPVIAIHGANYKKPEFKKGGIYNTLSFLDWLLNFIEKKNISIRLAIETLKREEERTIGDNRNDIYIILNEFQSPKLGICWDMCHDFTNYYPGKIPHDDEFYQNIIYSHIHGVNLEQSISHIPVKDSDLDFLEQLNFLLNKDYDGVLNLELLLSYCGKSYLDDLFEDIEFIKTVLKNQQN
ncbi:MAG: hypothetical protein PWQ37_580 [Candidatus Petromonas sp.]|jgi:sugar phosphate isomerase/epimerase|nr:hypothetical protein [Candidatus Petromonas sp.]